MVAGLVALAVANELVIVHPYGSTPEPGSPSQEALSLLASWSAEAAHVRH